MDIVRYLLLREAPEAVRQSLTRKYHREYMRSRPDLREKNLARKKARYATDPEHREKRKADSRARSKALTAEQRKAIAQRRKERLAALPEAEYERRRQAAAERCREYRKRKKEQQCTKQSRGA